MASRIKIIGKGAIMVLVVLFCSCTKYNYIDGGVANGIHDCSMWDYFHTSSYNWDSTIIMIEHAGLKSLFDGTGEHKQITFFGLTNLSIRRYMAENNFGLEKDDPQYLHRVTDMNPEWCKNVLEKLVAPRRLMLNDVPRGNRVAGTGDYKQYDGMELPCIQGSLFLWTLRKDYNDIQDAGEVVFYIASQNVQGARSEQVVSTDIQTNNGVVQALNYDFRFNNF